MSKQSQEALQGCFHTIASARGVVDKCKLSIHNLEMVQNRVMGQIERLKQLQVDAERIIYCVGEEAKGIAGVRK